MPIFEYRCEKCGYVFEQLCMKKNDEDVHCPSCGGKDVIRIMSMFSAGRGSLFGNAGSGLPSSCSPKGGFS